MRVISIAVVLVLSLMVTGTAMAQPTACSAGATTGLPEGSLVNPETSFTVTCDGFTFPTAETAVFFDPNNVLPSDIVILTNGVAGVATITFISDGELGLNLPCPLCINVTEPNAFVALAVSTTGGSNSVLKFTSDADNGTPTACGASDCMSASAVPEPATLALLGIGVLGGGVMRRRRRSGPAAGEK